MALAIRLPDMGTNVEECKVLKWRIKPGETVKRGEVLAEIETDKAVAELELTGEGFLLEIVVNAGEVARTGDILAYVGKPGESVAREAESAPGPAATPPRRSVALGAAPVQREDVQPFRHETAFPAATTSRFENTQELRVAPVVRNLAAKLGVDLSRVRGTGAGGVITREDVQRASREKDI